MDDSEEGPSAAKKQKIEYRGSLRKWSGAATYRSKFQVWQQKWPFAVPVKGDPHCFRCTVCAKTVSCGHQEETDVACHVEFIQHQRNTKAVKATQKLNFKPTTQLLRDKVTRAEVKVANLLVQHNVQLYLPLDFVKLINALYLFLFIHCHSGRATRCYFS